MPAANAPTSTLSGHVVIAGFGIVGRMVTEVMKQQKIPYCIVESNRATVDRCEKIDIPIMYGDIREEAVLRAAGIEQAAMLAVALPNEKDALQAVEIARRLNPKLPIIARCAFTSGGLQALQLGATVAVVAEQVVAQEFARVVREHLAKPE